MKRLIVLTVAFAVAFATIGAAYASSTPDAVTCSSGRVYIGNTEGTYLLYYDSFNGLVFLDQNQSGSTSYCMVNDSQGNTEFVQYGTNLCLGDLSSDLVETTCNNFTSQQFSGFLVGYPTYVYVNYPSGGSCLHGRGANANPNFLAYPCNQTNETWELFTSRP